MIVPTVLEPLYTQAAPLYNGNIAAMAVSIPKLGAPRVYNYHYDQLNRIGQMDAYNGLNNSTGVFVPTQLSDYMERANYDPNGNILAYQRNGYPASGQQIPMDSLHYTYYPNTNQLQRIKDTVSAGKYSVDIDDQGTGSNYTYDSIGNLKTDVAAGLTGVTWTVYGKIASITNGSGTIYYTYDAAGNRITKTYNDTLTLYVRDAQGNVMSVYRQPTGGGTVVQTETDLYGSSRLGLVGALTVAPTAVSMGSGYGVPMLGTFTRGEKVFELSNHLGNVLATITDKKIAVSSTSNSSLIDHYLADQLSAQDYYPFGMEMPGRVFNNGGYRYGFNGKENDNEVKGVAEQQDYGMRMYDPRVGKFLSVDPISKKYPELSPYQFASNRPIEGVDMDGLEFLSSFISGAHSFGLGISMAWITNAQAQTTYNQAHGIPDGGFLYNYRMQQYKAAGLAVGLAAAAYGGSYVTYNFWEIYPALLYNPIVQTEIVGGLAALAGYEGPDIPMPGQIVEGTFRRTWEEYAITSTDGGRTVLNQELRKSAELIMHGGSSFATTAEKNMAQKLLSEGNTVEVLAESTEKYGRTADYVINGIHTELKTVSNIATSDLGKISNTLSQTINKSKGQGTALILDVTGQQNASQEVVERALKKYWGQGSSKTDIRVIGNGFDKSYKKTDFYPQ